MNIGNGGDDQRYKSSQVEQTPAEDAAEREGDPGSETKGKVRVSMSAEVDRGDARGGVSTTRTNRRRDSEHHWEDAKMA